tara:strand:- start:528 stop:758 length:231 start_codon:yes stop_codon:yes gene_type:complete
MKDRLKYATISEKAKAFDLLLKYHAQEGRNYSATGTVHQDQTARMNTYLWAVLENHPMVADESDLYMDYSIWEADE